jgi:photosystem II stability/assembly factor-like uncharacterized protein
LIEAPALVKIQFFNELEGWALTGTQVARTNDGGLTWYDVTPPDLTATEYSLEVFFLDTTHAWLQKPELNNFPKKGVQYYTSDGGSTWISSSTPFSGGDLSFLDENHGWMLADLGLGAGSHAVAVFQTSDGGATWTQTYTNEPNLPDVAHSLPLGGIKSDLVPLDAQTAWVGGVIYSPGTVYLFRTHDGGRSWLPVNLELPAGAHSFEVTINRDQMQFVSATDGFLVVRMSGDSTQTIVYVTNDAGNTWTLAPTLIPNSGESVFLSAEEAVIYNGEQLYVTRDAARTWTIIAPDIVFGESLAAMDFVNPSSGWIITDSENHRSLYRTYDGGATWSAILP